MTRDDPGDAQVLQDLRTANDTYAAASDRVVALYVAGDLAAASKLHLDEEHPDSHVLEASLHALIDSADQQINEAQAAFESDRALLDERGGGVLRGGRGGGPPPRVRPVLGVHPADPQDGHGPRRDHRRRPQPAGRRAERRRVRAARPRPQPDERPPDRAVRGGARPGRPARGDERLARPCERGQVALPGQRQPRAADADERHPRVHRRPARRRRRAAQPGPDRVAQLGPARRPRPARPDQRDPRPVEDRGRPADDRRPAVRPARARRGGRGPVALAGRPEGAQLQLGGPGAPAEVVLDRQRVSQILVNLFGNALKFTREGEVRVETSGAAESVFRVAVRDSGPGSPPDLHEAIFEEFRQAEGEEAGTGLGLAISRRLARAMGGDITLDSAPGRGSTFYLTLPLDCRTEPVAQAQAEPDRGSDTARVLLSVDDDPSVAPLLEKMVAGHGYRDRRLGRRPGRRGRRPPPATRGDPARRPHAGPRWPRRPPRAQGRSRGLGHPGDRPVGRGRRRGARPRRRLPGQARPPGPAPEPARGARRGPRGGVRDGDDPARRGHAGEPGPGDEAARGRRPPGPDAPTPPRPGSRSPGNGSRTWSCSTSGCPT